jgi:hypothetical protein
MPQTMSAKKVYNDEWGDTRIGYEDRPTYQVRKKSQGREPNKFVGSIGSLLIVGGVCWGTYLLTSGKLDPSGLMNFPGPLHVVVAGVIVSLISKFIG